MHSQAFIPPQAFLAVYDYGQGGVWLLLEAPSSEAAKAKFPGLTVFDARPGWMSEQQEQQLRSKCEETGFRWGVQAEPTGWLLYFLSNWGERNG